MDLLLDSLLTTQCLNLAHCCEVPNSCAVRNNSLGWKISENVIAV